MLGIMNNKYTLPLFIITICLVCVYFLSVIFSGTTIKNLLPINLVVQKSQKKDLEVTAQATPTTIIASESADLKNAPSSNIEIAYKNKSGRALTGIRIKIFSVASKAQYRTASTATAIFNKQETQIDKHATYNIESVDPGQTGKANIRIYTSGSKEIRFKAIISTHEGVQATSSPVIITVL